MPKGKHSRSLSLFILLKLQFGPYQFQFFGFTSHSHKVHSFFRKLTCILDYFHDGCITASQFTSFCPRVILIDFHWPLIFFSWYYMFCFCAQMPHVFLPYNSNNLQFYVQTLFVLYSNLTLFLCLIQPHLNFIYHRILRLSMMYTCPTAQKTVILPWVLWSFFSHKGT